MLFRSLTFNGNKTEEQFEGRKLGAIGATSITATDPGVSTAMTKGLMSGAYSLGDQMVKLHLSATKISSYQFDSLNPAADPALGKTSTSYTGNLDPNLRSHPWWLGTSNFLSGDITTLSTRGTKLLRSEVLKGKLSIDANFDYAPPPEPLTSEVPAIYVIKTSFNTSTANSYDASYYDGSYLRMKSSTGVAVNASMKMPELLSDADLWSGDDDIKIDMPSYCVVRQVMTFSMAVPEMTFSMVAQASIP